MKFDVILGNPPYEGKSELHLRFLNHSVDDFSSENGVIKFIHPSAWILTKTHDKRDKKNEVLAIKNIHKYHTTFEFINGNKLFPNANFFYPLVITTIDKKIPHQNEFKIKDNINDRILKFNNFQDVNYHSDSKIYLNLRNKIISYVKTHPNLFNVGNSKKQYNVSLSKLRGSQCDINFFKNDFYTLIPRNCVPTPINKTTSNFTYGFDSLEEATNFIEYLKTDFARFCLSLYKITGNIKSGNIHKAIPYLNFNEKWDDQKLFDKFNINKQEQSFIKNIIPPFY